MGKRKRRLSAAEKAAKEKQRQEYETIFIQGRMKRIRRPPTVEGMSVDDFIRANADQIFLHQEGLREYLEADDRVSPIPDRPMMTADGRELVSFITVENDDDLIVAYAIDLEDPAEIASLILQRTPKYEGLLPKEERGVVVSHELYPEDDRELARRIVVSGSEVDIETTVRTYHLDLSKVDPDEVANARKVLRRMHRVGGFALGLR